jgi:phage-related protein (TIGR01555 family)
MAVVPFLRDSLRNLVSGLGTSKDPTTSSHYHYHELNREQLISAYRSNWVARRVVDAVAEDATREWRSWQAEQKKIEVIENLERDFDIQRKVKQAITRARLFGGAGLVLGVDGSGETSEPLDYDALGEDCLRFVVVLNRYELSAGPRIYDAESPWFSRPEYYTVSTPMTGVREPGSIDYGMVKIHPSRVVEFWGNELPDWRLATLGAGWGDSVLQTLDETLKDFGLTMGGIANMVNDAKVDIIKIPNLADKLKTSDTTNKLFERFQYANVGKSTLNALLIDATEEWQRTQTNFGGLPMIMQEFMTLVSAGAGIPVSRLMGSAPGKGLSSVGGGDSDLRNYYDDITSKQKTVYAPAMRPLDAVIQISCLGKLDKGITYDWSPLYRPDPKEVAEVASAKATATQVYVNLGLINEDAMREAVVSQLIEDGTYPGLSDAIDEFDAEPPEPETPSPEDMQAHIGMLQKSSQQLQQLGNAATQPKQLTGPVADAMNRKFGD